MDAPYGYDGGLAMRGAVARGSPGSPLALARRQTARACPVRRGAAQCASTCCAARRCCVGTGTAGRTLT
jgi:hypothetical protein